MRNRKHKLSEVIRRHLDEAGVDRELENYAHGRLTKEEEELFLEPLTAISVKYMVGWTPGVFNPDARLELEALAMSLEQRGL